MSIPLDGVTFSDSDWENRGHLTLITVNGQSYQRWEGMWVAGIREISTRISATGSSLSATSSTSATIGTGAKALTVETDKGFAAGNVVIASENGTPANYMLGTVTSYNTDTGALAFTVASGDTGGSGTIADWVVTISGPRGPGGGITGGTLLGDIDGAGTQTLTNVRSPTTGADVASYAVALGAAYALSI